MNVHTVELELEPHFQGASLTQASDDREPATRGQPWGNCLLFSSPDSRRRKKRAQQGDDQIKHVPKQRKQQNEPLSFLTLFLSFLKIFFFNVDHFLSLLNLLPCCFHFMFGEGTGNFVEGKKEGQFSSVAQSCLFVTPWTAARQASLSIINSWSLLKFTSIESVMPSNNLILCRPPSPSASTSVLPMNTRD